MTSRRFDISDHDVAVVKLTNHDHGVPAMRENQDSVVDTEATPPARDECTDSRRSYHPPVLERLGPWSALTLQQTIPI